MRKIKILIDPYANVYYSSFYIKGLYEKFGKENVCFDTKPFNNIQSRSVNFNFIVVDENGLKKYTIHHDDPYDVKKELYDWCDIYGNVNTNFSKTPVEYHEKLISLAPSFGIRLWNLAQTVFYLSENYTKVDKSINLRKFAGTYKRQYLLRLALSEYEKSGVNQNNYIFHLSTLWYSDEWNKNDQGVNLTRYNFIQACKSIGNLNFEGGLVPHRKEINPKFAPVLFTENISMLKYIENIRKSMLVFNTPAFWSCHGWKLGEYLAMGKAIISTKLSNDLPEPLVHGKNIHFVENNIESMRDAISLILSNDDYRTKLENGAREYWQKYGTPVKSLELLGL